MKMNIHKCDLCDTTFNYDEVIDDFPAIDRHDHISTLRVILGSQHSLYETPRYRTDLDLCPKCIKKILSMCQIKYRENGKR